MNDTEVELLEGGLNEKIEWLEEKEKEIHSNEKEFGQRSEIECYKHWS